MRKTMTVLAVLTVFLAASAALAQMQPMTPPQGQPPAGQGSHPMMGQPGSGGMMCPMMGMMGGSMMGGMQEPGMMGPGMSGMMMGSRDPKTMARMLRMRGEMMKAMGDIMMRHGAEMEQAK